MIRGRSIRCAARRLPTSSSGWTRSRRWTFNRVAMTDLAALGVARPDGRYTALREPSPATLTATAASIGDRICELAITDGQRATWLVPIPADKKRLVATAAGIDLYNGLSGIALFLGYLGAATGERGYRRLAAAAMAEALAVYKSSDSTTFPPGAYAGVGGFAYVLARLAHLLGRPDWLDEATAILRKGARQALGSRDIDVITGQAGFLMAALATRCHLGDPGLSRMLAALAGKLYRLVTATQKRGQSKLPGKADAGIAHGRAGIGFALKRWSEFRPGHRCGVTAQTQIAADLKALGSGARHA
jgi:lantibiotic modifying enzyme